jgi:hypothetical protein
VAIAYIFLILVSLDQEKFGNPGPAHDTHKYKYLHMYVTYELSVIKRPCKQLAMCKDLDNCFFEKTVLAQVYFLPTGSFCKTPACSKSTEQRNSCQKNVMKALHT